MPLRPEEVSKIIQKEIEKYKTKLKMESIGVVLEVGDGIARIWGLDDAMINEMVQFPNEITGLVLNLEQGSVGVVILGQDEDLKEGDIVKRTGKVISVPVGEALIGRVVNALGQPLDGKGPIVPNGYRNIENIAPNVVQRQPVNEPVQTGLKAIDSMIPIGRGQRELIIGDRQTGKTALALDTIINQKGSGIYCIYVGIGQKASTIAKVVQTLSDHNAMEHTIVVAASATDPASLQYIAPYAGCAMGEYFLYNKKDALIVYDDLTKHAQAYRQLSLLLRRPPGREAYPGDIFYLHARLLERAARLIDKDGTKGGSLTALPIVETQAGDISAYIPTNIISITDGQIYLESELFYAKIRPAINIGISVSRVGGNAQTKAMKDVAGRLKLELAQYQELAAFAQFGSELDEASKNQLNRGKKTVEILKQVQYEPMPLEKQVMIIYVATHGYLDKLELEQVKPFELGFHKHMDKEFPDVVASISQKKDIDASTDKKLNDAIKIFKQNFLEAEEMINYLAAHKFLKNSEQKLFKTFELDFHRLMKNNNPELIRSFAQTVDPDQDTGEKLNKNLNDFRKILSERLSEYLKHFNLEISETSPLEFYNLLITQYPYVVYSILSPQVSYSIASEREKTEQRYRDDYVILDLSKGLDEATKKKLNEAVWKFNQKKQGEK